MRILSGQKVSAGIAIAPAIVLTKKEVRVQAAYVPEDRIETEVRRFRRALGRTRTDIKQLRDEQREGMPEVRRIIDTSITLLNDPLMIQSVEAKIRGEACTAQYAVNLALGELATSLSAIDNPVFSSKVSDIHDIEHRIVNHLVGGRLERVQQLDFRSVVVADDITPTQAATLDREHVLGFATTRGSWASHTAILARALGIPAVVGVPDLTRHASFRARVIVDGNRGLVVIDPDEETLDEYRRRRRRSQRRITQSLQTKHLKSETREGEECLLFGNVETKEDVPRVVEFGGIGVGLFRTEFLFLGQDEPPDEESQYCQYRDAVDHMGDGVVTIRSMDFGGDKFDRRTNDVDEPNPFMGERAIRVSFKRPEMFRTQLRAILRASDHGKVQLMFPMIMDVGEFLRAKAVLDDARNELREEGVPFDENMPVGTMIELPSAALNAERLARVVDFFSIGTNDLTQYSLGVDRTNHRVADLYASQHPSIARMIRHVVVAASESNLPVSVCGEMAGDPFMVPLLLGLGIRRLSIAPPQIPEVKKKIRALFLSRCIQLADRAVDADDAREVSDLLSAFS